ncbi:MAG: RDD family protein [Cyclobacteriaceae bacterium]
MDLNYASFWKRLTAYNIDLTVLVLVLFPLSIVIEDNSLFYGVCLTVVIGYHAGLESSRYQATLGKKYHGLRVVDKEGQPLSFTKALLRILLKFVSAAIALGGFTMIAFNKRKQGLHDYILGTYIVMQ